MSTTNCEFSTLDVCRELGIPRERLRVWIDKGFIHPSIHMSEKQGEKNLFSLRDVCKIEAFRILVDYGYTRSLASKVVY